MTIRRTLTIAASAALLVFPASAASAHQHGGPDIDCASIGRILAEDGSCVSSTFYDEPEEDEPGFDCRIHGNQTCAYRVDLGDGAGAAALGIYANGVQVDAVWRDHVDVYGMQYPMGTDAHGAPVYLYGDTSADGIGYAYLP